MTLKDEDKTLFEQWTEYNFNAYWSEADGPLKADVVVIDDPQRTSFSKLPLPLALSCRSFCSRRLDTLHQKAKPQNADNLPLAHRE